MKVLVTGATGWVGRHLVAKLEQPVVLTRKLKSARAAFSRQVDAIQWSGSPGQLDGGELPRSYSLVNLMGESIAEGRWSAAKKERIRHSRVDATTDLVDSILRSKNLPECVISASAVGYYGDRQDQPLPEDSPAGDDFLAHVCYQWEAAAKPLAEAGVRVVWLRLGIVLGKGGGALQKMLTPFRFGLGGRLASGEQWMSWIHLDDLITLMLFLLKDEALQGAFNATSPHPVRNSEFTKSLAGALKRPALMPVPHFALKLAIGEFADYLVSSQRVVPQRLLETLFQYEFPDLKLALAQIIGSPA